MSKLLTIDKAGFFEFLQMQAEGRFEFDRGCIVQQMTGGTLVHMRLVQRFASSFERQLNSQDWPQDWIVTTHGRGVETRDTIRYPDVVVEKSGADPAGLATVAPVVIVEVLSPSTKFLDLNTKPAEYARLASLAAYIVASQTSAECLVWSRDQAGLFSADPVRIAGEGASLELEFLRVAINLSDLYQGLFPPR